MNSICFPTNFMIFILKNLRNSMTSAKRSNVQTKPTHNGGWLSHLRVSNTRPGLRPSRAPRCGSGMTMSRQVNTICKKAFYHLRSIASISRFLSQQHCEILVYAFVTSALGCCNSLLHFLPQYQNKKLQYVQRLWHKFSLALANMSIWQLS